MPSTCLKTDVFANKVVKFYLFKYKQIPWLIKNPSKSRQTTAISECSNSNV